MFVNEESGVEGLCLDCALSGVVSIAGVLEWPGCIWESSERLGSNWIPCLAFPGSGITVEATFWSWYSSLPVAGVYNRAVDDDDVVWVQELPSPEKNPVSWLSFCTEESQRIEQSAAFHSALSIDSGEWRLQDWGHLSPKSPPGMEGRFKSDWLPGAPINILSPTSGLTVLGGGWGCLVFGMAPSLALGLTTGNLKEGSGAKEDEYLRVHTWEWNETLSL